MNFVSSVGDRYKPWMLEQKISHRTEWWRDQTLIMPALSERGPFKFWEDRDAHISQEPVWYFVQFICIILFSLFCTLTFFNEGHHYWFISFFKTSNLWWLNHQYARAIISVHARLLFIDQRVTLSCCDNSRKTRWGDSRAMAPYRRERKRSCHYGYGDSDRQVNRDGCEMSVSRQPLLAAAHSRQWRLSVHRLYSKQRESGLLRGFYRRHRIRREMHELERRARCYGAISGERSWRAQLLSEPGRENSALVFLPKQPRAHWLGVLRLQTRYRLHEIKWSNLQEQ